MKIFCLHQNYPPATASRQPIVFLKPDSALLKDHKPFFIPDFMGAVDYEAQIAVRISRLGKSIPERFAHRYYDAFTLAIDFTASDMLREAQQSGMPWDVAKGFDGSAVIGEWKDKDLFLSPNAIDFSLNINGKMAQEATSAGMLHSIDATIAYLSRFYTLKTGDIIFTGAPHSAAPACIDDHYEGFLGEYKVLEFNCK